MVDTPRETWITGVGIVSSLGEGADAHWQALEAGKIHIETARPSHPTSSIRWRR